MDLERKKKDPSATLRMTRKLDPRVKPEDDKKKAHGKVTPLYSPLVRGYHRGCQGLPLQGRHRRERAIIKRPQGGGYGLRVASKETVTEGHTLPQIGRLPRAHGWE